MPREERKKTALTVWLGLFGADEQSKSELILGF